MNDIARRLLAGLLLVLDEKMLRALAATVPPSSPIDARVRVAASRLNRHNLLQLNIWRVPPALVGGMQGKATWPRSRLANCTVSAPISEAFHIT